MAMLYLLMARIRGSALRPMISALLHLIAESSTKTFTLWSVIR
ncbi:hypothetical protein FOMG_14951 [Fusarium oxysporum f. sp. melonis 26406]|uniref:Uncharacterized protein n=1 Tax=Fusarium oxysporum f. sp. melonis 26406 TaxID=1089452 RepID=W9ZAU7_FUSOX|nr:hypothetical protein FOMG_14951 [Fusarium oxysporum f. sp. melonis 26406]